MQVKLMFDGIDAYTSSALSHKTGQYYDHVMKKVRVLYLHKTSYQCCYWSIDGDIFCVYIGVICWRFNLYTVDL